MYGFAAIYGQNLEEKKNREEFAFPMPALHPQTVGMSVVEKARDPDGRIGSGWYQDFFFRHKSLSG